MNRAKQIKTTQWMEAAQEGCFDACEQPNELTFLSIPEGICLRNCVTKLNYLMPMLDRRVQNSSWIEEYERLQDYRKSKGYLNPLHPDL